MAEIWDTEMGVAIEKVADIFLKKKYKEYDQKDYKKKVRVVITKLKDKPNATRR